MHCSSFDIDLSGVTQFAGSFKVLSSVHAVSIILKGVYDLPNCVLRGALRTSRNEDSESRGKFKRIRMRVI